MVLSQTAKYGIRALLHLAKNRTRPLLSKEIATDLNIPVFFLAKILQDLARYGLLRSYKGPRGGFELARPPDKIKLIEVVQAIEGVNFGKECLLTALPCSDKNPCDLHGRWAQIRKGILQMLHEETLEQLAQKKDGRWK